MKRLLFVLLALGMLACSPRDIGAQVGSSVPGLPTSSSSPHCAELYMQAQVSPKPVTGVWNCMAQSVQDTVSKAGTATGDGFLATNTGYSEQYWYLGRERTGGYVYEVRATSGSTVLVATMVVYLDSDGKVANARSTNPIQQS